MESRNATRRGGIAEAAVSQQNLRGRVPTQEPACFPSVPSLYAGPFLLVMDPSLFLFLCREFSAVSVALTRSPSPQSLYVFDLFEASALDLAPKSLRLKRFRFLSRGYVSPCLHCGLPIADRLQIYGGPAHIEFRSIRQRRVPIHHEGGLLWNYVIAMKRKGP